MNFYDKCSTLAKDLQDCYRNQKNNRKDTEEHMQKARGIREIQSNRSSTSQNDIFYSRCSNLCFMKFLSKFFIVLSQLLLCKGA